MKLDVKFLVAERYVINTHAAFSPSLPFVPHSICYNQFIEGKHMGVRYIKEPDLIDPVMVAAWPGIGNIGLIALDTLRRALRAEHMAYIEPSQFFYPRKVLYAAVSWLSLNFQPVIFSTTGPAGVI
jgi:hypothetical protein